MADVVMIPTADGEMLEAEVFLPDAPRAAVVITHPHPLMGGDMYTPVPAGFFRSLDGLGLAGLRFNFRGVGASTGTHDEGGAERLDVAAALEHLAEAAPGVPIVLAGWSFGADVSLTCDDDRVAGWFLAAPPLRVVDPSEMAAQSAAAPKLLAVGENDQFNNPEAAAATVAEWQNTTVEVVPGADHFFGPQLPLLVDKFTAFVNGLLNSAD